MANYNDGLWHGWNGGECPVHPEAVVEVLLRSGCEDGPANVVDWDHKYDPVIAFRVIKEHKEPREFWAVNMTWWKGVPDGTNQWVEVEPGTRNATLFREVLP